MRLREIKRRTWIYALYKHIQESIYMKYPVEMTKRFYKKQMKKPLNLDNPRDLNEKIQWLKLYSDTSAWTLLADKYRVRDFIRERGLGHLLVELYGAWDSPDEIDFDTLPDKFVIKTNNGFNDSIIVRDKSKMNAAEVRGKMRASLNRHFGVSTLEPHYLRISPKKIIAERLLEDNTIGEFSRSLIDYKLWCFNGEPFGFYVVYDRAIGTSYHVRDFYDLDWNHRTDWMTDKSPRHPIPKPKGIETMIEAGKILSKGFPEMRVDFYDIDGDIHLGELTMSATSGCMSYFSPELLLAMGEKCDISHVKRR